MSITVKRDVVAIAMADLHRTEKRPICRKEKDIMSTQDAKLDKIAKLARHYGVPILDAGDTYDLTDCSHHLVYTTKELLWGVELIFCHGQHELPDHDILQATRSPMIHHAHRTQKSPFYIGKDVDVYTCDWGCKVPEITTRQTATLRILVMHKMVYVGEKPFPGAKGNVEKLLEKNPKYYQYDLIITGDNHKMFVQRFGKLTWLNCGCVFRTASNEIDYVPRCWIIETDGKQLYVTPCILPYLRDDVSEEHLEDAKIEAECSKEFAMSLANLPIRKKSSYSDNVQRVCRKEEKPIKKKINKFLGA